MKSIIHKIYPTVLATLIIFGIGSLSYFIVKKNNNLGGSEYYHQQANFNAGATTTNLDNLGYSSTTEWMKISEYLTVDEYGQFNNVSTTDTLSIGGYASSTGGFYTQGDIYAGDDLEIEGNATTTGYVYSPYLKFQESYATPTAPATGTCFMPNAELKCYNGANWIKYSGTAE